MCVVSCSCLRRTYHSITRRSRNCYRPPWPSVVPVTSWLRSWVTEPTTSTRGQSLIPPSHRRRGATAVLVRHKPQWHRRDSTVVPSLIVVASRKTVKTADLRGGTAATFNMFRGASAVLVPSHRGRDARAVLVRHKPHWHRHDRRGSASDRRSTAENGQHCGPSRGHGGNFEHVQNFRRPPRVGPIRSGIAAAPPWPPWHRRGTAMTAVVSYKNRSSTSITAVSPQYNRRAIAKT